ncbi:hypothetical protein GCM10009619_08070 [Williamsia maris]
MLTTMMLAGPVAVLTAGPASACSCATIGTPTEAVSRASGVFVARATDKLSDGTSDIYEFSVSTVYKGDVGTRTTVRTSSQGASCGAEYRVGDEYLLFVGRTRGIHPTWEASLCSPGAGGAFDVRAVTEQVYGPGHPPDGPSREIGRWTRMTAGIPDFVLLFVGVIVLGVGWAGVVHLRRRRS